MQNSRMYGDPQYDLHAQNEYVEPYSDDRRASASTYPSYAPTQARRSSKTHDNRFSLSSRTLVDDYDPGLETRSWRSGSVSERRDVALPTRLSMQTTDHRRGTAATFSPIGEDSNTTSRRKKKKKSKDVVYIETLTIPANGPSLETHLRNTKGNVHIKHLRIEDETAISPTHSSHRKSKRERRSRPRQAEKESESVSKLTRVCELATVAALVLQWKEYKSNKS